MEFQAAQHTIDRLILWIRTSRLALPDFQRDFVWTPSRVTELLDSVARQWPIGSLLLLSGPQKIGAKPIQNAPALRGGGLDYYVLDGQQRLTALYQAVMDVSDVCYYIDFRTLAADEDDYIRWEKRAVFERQYPTIEDRAGAGVALIRDIWELDVFYTWLSGIPDPGLQKAYVSLREQRLGGLRTKVYKVMAIELDQEIEIEALARIFETLNRTGVRLNAFDLMVAMLYPRGFHLRDKWQEALNENDFTNAFSVDAVEVLKLTALLIRFHEGKTKSRGVRQGDLLNIDGSLITRYWDAAVGLYERSLCYANKHLGVFCPDVMPAWGLVLGVGAWLTRGSPESIEPTIREWFWGTVFEQTYAQAANTTVVADFDGIVGERGARLARQRICGEFSALSDPAKRNGLAMRGLGCFLACIGACDPISGVPLRELTRVTFRALDATGQLRPLESEDSFDRVVVLSPESARLAAKRGSSEGLLFVDQQFKERLSTQLIGEGYIRNIEQLKAAIRNLGRTGAFL